MEFNVLCMGDIRGWAKLEDRTSFGYSAGRVLYVVSTRPLASAALRSHSQDRFVVPGL